jgi:hypothetical protein
MRRSNRRIEREALELEQERVVHEFFEFDFIGDDLFFHRGARSVPTAIQENGFWRSENVLGWQCIY